MIKADVDGSAMEVMKVTSDSLMKLGKGDAILNGPDMLFDQLASVFRSWLVHGTVTSLLDCAFLPLLKSALKDPLLCLFSSKKIQTYVAVL